MALSRTQPPFADADFAYTETVCACDTLSVTAQQASPKQSLYGATGSQIETVFCCAVAEPTGSGTEHAIAANFQRLPSSEFDPLDVRLKQSK